MKLTGFLTATLITLYPLTVTAASEYSTVPTNDYEPVKAEIIDATAANFTINVKSLSNVGVDQKAEMFSVYTASSKPDECADFRDEELTYEKPEKYLRRFDLSDKPMIIAAIEEQGCVTIPNIPPKE